MADLDSKLSHFPSQFYGCESSSSLSAYFHQMNTPLPHIFVIPEKDFDSLEKSLLFFNPEQKIYKLPSLDPAFPSKKVLLERVRWLHQALSPQMDDIFLCSQQSLLQKTLPYQSFQKSSLTLTKNSKLPSLHFLKEAGYMEAFPLEEEGFFHQKGGILDIFSPAHLLPVRIEVLGDEVASLRFFDPITNLNKDPCQALHIIPTFEASIPSETRLQTIRQLKQIKDFPLFIIKKITQGLFFQEKPLLIPFIHKNPSSALDFFQKPLPLWIKDSELQVDLKDSLTSHSSIHNILVDNFYFKEINFPSNATILHSLLKDDKNTWPIQTVKQKKEESFQNLRKKPFLVLAVSNETHMDQLKFKLEKQNFEPQIITSSKRQWSEWKNEQIENPNKIHLILGFLPESFETPDSLFLKGESWLNKASSQKTLTPEQYGFSEKLKALHFSEIKAGELIVDKIHGIGRYKGLKTLNLHNNIGEYIELEYKNDEKLYLPVSQLNRLFQFKTQVTTKILDRLGGNQWKQKLSKAQSSIKNLVLELLQAYSSRNRIQRPAFPPSSPDLIQFEKEFPFTETQHQGKAISDIYQDMQKPQPMDRLIIGDSGYGKTEVAMRAAFKAVEAGFQVAFLAPTTILSLQHFNNFKERFKNWPIKIEVVNRLASSQKIKSVLKDLSQQKIDILIGSHRLLSSDIQFKKLGLVIIDEEHRFGVQQKEKLKKLKLNVDCIYMSATPIPRTLSMGLSQFKNISIIQTPPQNRVAPKVFLMNLQEDKIKAAITKEIQRGGQVIFVHNRLQTLPLIHEKLSKWFPQLQIQIVHGQMKEQLLEKNILDFFKHKSDILLCTTIVESGMDFSRVNTIIIHDAHMLGLSQLYQLKGRVGRRSSIQPYCYLLIPEHLPEDAPAINRLNFLQRHSYLGSGYRIAHYDLEMRGGGEFLGARQSGHISDIGYDLFLEMLDEELHPKKIKALEPEVKLPWAAYIPESYIVHDKIRLMYYKYLSSLENTKESFNTLDSLERELSDAFGPLPVEVKNLFGQVIIKHLCQTLEINELKIIGQNLYLTQGELKTKVKLPEEFSWVSIQDLLQQMISNKSTSENKPISSKRKFNK